MKSTRIETATNSSPVRPAAAPPAIVENVLHFSKRGSLVSSPGATTPVMPGESTDQVEGLDRRGHHTRTLWRTYFMSQIRRFDHVGITVADLDTATAFFVGLGLEVEGRAFLEGEFVDTVTGIPGSRSHMVMLRPPGGGTGLELSTFVSPDHEPGS